MQRPRVCGTPKDRIGENNIQAVQVGANIRVLRKRDNEATFLRLHNHEGFVRELFAVLFPDIAACEQIVDRLKSSDVNTGVEPDRRVDIRATYQYV